MLKALGKFLAALGGFALRGALLASQHPDVITAVTAAVGHPEIGKVLNTANTVVAAVETK